MGVSHKIAGSAMCECDKTQACSYVRISHVGRSKAYYSWMLLKDLESNETVREGVGLETVGIKAKLKLW